VSARENDTDWKFTIFVTGKEATPIFFSSVRQLKSRGLKVRQGTIPALIRSKKIREISLNEVRTEIKRDTLLS
jgi:hypothetical protein